MGAVVEPTEEQRRTVQAMSGFGIPQADIATLLEVGPKTLRKHCRRELDRGSIEATAKVAQTLFQMATSGQNTAAAIFWMKARAGWREKHEVQVTTRPLQGLSDADLHEMIHYTQQRIEIEWEEAEEAAAERPVLEHHREPG